MRKLIPAVLLSMSLSSSALADGLVQQLPQDTSWVLFKTEGSEDKSHRGGKVKRFAGQLKISSVGTATVDGQKCRWIETEHTYRRPDDPTDAERGSVYKLLIPEEYLTRGESPADQIRRGWWNGLGTFARDKPGKLQTAHGTPVPRSSLELEMQFYLSGPAADVRSLEPMVVESKLGKLKCAGITGSIDTSSLPNPDNAPLKPPTFEIRLHEKAPFGVVSYMITATEPSGDRVEMRGVLEDFGKTAVSRLPEFE